MSYDPDDIDPGNIDLGDYDSYGDDFSDLDELGFRGHPVVPEFEDEEEEEYGDEEEIEDSLFQEILFADPNGVSALRAASADNPRTFPCPTCHQPNRLTPADVAQGYQCDECADRDERGG